MTTPDPDTLLAIAETVERLTEGDRVVDGEIAWHLTPEDDRTVIDGERCLATLWWADGRRSFEKVSTLAERGDRLVPECTSDHAAALGLVMPQTPIETYDNGLCCKASIAHESCVDGIRSDYVGGDGRAGRFARAVTAAVLRAMAEAPEPVERLADEAGLGAEVRQAMEEIDGNS